MGSSLSSLRCITNIAGLSSLVLSLFPKMIIKNPKVLRPLLNVSWGYLFGSTFWFCFFYEVGLIRGLQNIKRTNVPQNAEEAKVALEELKLTEKDVDRRNIDFHYFFSLSTLFSSVLLLSTVRLASQNLQLRISSSVVTVSCLLNSLFLHAKLNKLKQKKENLYNELVKSTKDGAGAIVTAIKKNKKEFHIYHGISVLSLYLSLIGLTPYIFT